jgi:hypothetical protein
MSIQPADNRRGAWRDEGSHEDDDGGDNDGGNDHNDDYAIDEEGDSGQSTRRDFSQGNGAGPGGAGVVDRSPSIEPPLIEPLRQRPLGRGDGGGLFQNPLSMLDATAWTIHQGGGGGGAESSGRDFTDEMGGEYDGDDYGDSDYINDDDNKDADDGDDGGDDGDGDGHGGGPRGAVRVGLGRGEWSQQRSRWADPEPAAGLGVALDGGGERAMDDHAAAPMVPTERSALGPREFPRRPAGHDGRDGVLEFDMGGAAAGSDKARRRGDLFLERSQARAAEAKVLALAPKPPPPARAPPIASPGGPGGGGAAGLSAGPLALSSKEQLASRLATGGTEGVPMKEAKERSKRLYAQLPEVLSSRCPCRPLLVRSCGLSCGGARGGHRILRGVCFNGTVRACLSWCKKLL